MIRLIVNLFCPTPLQILKKRLKQSRKEREKFQKLIFNIELQLLKLSIRRGLTPVEMKFEVDLQRIVEHLHLCDEYINNEIYFVERAIKIHSK